VYLGACALSAEVRVRSSKGKSEELPSGTPATGGNDPLGAGTAGGLARLKEVSGENLRERKTRTQRECRVWREGVTDKERGTRKEGALPDRGERKGYRPSREKSERGARLLDESQVKGRTEGAASREGKVPSNGITS